MEFLFIGLGGMLGAISRYLISGLMARKWQEEFPLGTFCINILGSFFLALFISQIPAADKYLTLKQVVATGFLGAFTTYSTFTFEFITLAEKEKKPLAAFYLLASLVLGLLAVILGLRLGDMAS